MANVKAFGEDASSGKRTLFNETTQSDDITTNLNDDYVKGWEVIGNNAPSIQDINAVCYTQGYLTSYLYQQGVPEWSSEQGYLKHNMVNFEGKIYSCKVGDETSRCYNKNPKTELSYWKEVGSDGEISSSNVGCSFLAKFSQHSNPITFTFLTQNLFINSTSFNVIKTKSTNTFSKSIDNRFYCPKKGVYFIKGSLTFKCTPSRFLTSNQMQKLVSRSPERIAIYKNGALAIESEANILYDTFYNITCPASVCGIIELNEGDYINLVFRIFYHSIADDVSIIEGSFMGYKI